MGVVTGQKWKMCCTPAASDATRLRESVKNIPEETNY